MSKEPSYCLVVVFYGKMYMENSNVCLRKVYTTCIQI